MPAAGNHVMAGPTGVFAILILVIGIPFRNCGVKRKMNQMIDKIIEREMFFIRRQMRRITVPNHHSVDGWLLSDEAG